MTNVKFHTLIVALALVAAGCGGGSSSHSSGSGNGTLAVRVTDAPYPYAMISQAIVVVNEVSIHGPGDGFTVIDSQTHAYDLVQLQQGKTALVTSATLPAGNYDQLRLVVSSGTLTLTDGRSFPLTVPSGDASGLKIFLNPPVTVSSGLSQELVLDFDLAQSFEPIPASAKQASDVTGFKMHPVVRAQVASNSGAITGHVTSLSGGAPIPNATVTVTDGTITQTVSTGADGSYFVGFLPAGNYTVTAQTVDGTPTTVPGVIVTNGNETTLDMKL